ncbi:hypothetical protein L3Y34_010602 [Caenorhabditis briggsae]|uniref:Uncharacterized protein n=1 Tax=Caenorhabditis briggsae TaxID=6238 RepID=A0AAE9CSU7_CAEBR|nr:hypothetical protein L3Y34_010602 [Caenorhabditis briggsae]
MKPKKRNQLDTSSSINTPLTLLSSPSKGCAGGISGGAGWCRRPSHWCTNERGEEFELAKLPKKEKRQKMIGYILDRGQHSYQNDKKESCLETDD